MTVVGRPSAPTGPIPEYECTFCQTKFVPRRRYSAHITHFICGKKECVNAAEQARRKRIREQANERSKMSWAERVAGEPGDIITEFHGKINGGRITANGGLAIGLLVSQTEKYNAMVATDTQGLMVKMTLSFPYPEHLLDKVTGELLYDPDELDESDWKPDDETIGDD